MTIRAYRIPVNDNDWIEITPHVHPDTWAIIGDSMTVKHGDWITDNTALGMHPRENGPAINEDHDSDGMQCFGISSHVEVCGIHFEDDLVRGTSSIEQIAQAARHVEFLAWCPGDV